MKVYNKDKTKILTEYDLEKGYLKEDTLITHYDEVKAIEEQFHYETIREYANGGKDVIKVIDVAKVEYKPARDEEEKIYVYIPYTQEELLERKKEQLRARREQECFSIINRGSLWYDNLSGVQLEELEEWYHKWLMAPQTLEVPEKPEWLK